MGVKLPTSTVLAMSRNAKAGAAYDAIPEKEQFPLFTAAGLQIATGFTRVVFGKRGAYVEFTPDQIIGEHVFVPADQRWRLTGRWRKKVYYDEYRTACETCAKLYFQRKTVDYADYRVHHFYVAPELLRPLEPVTPPCDTVIPAVTPEPLDKLEILSTQGMQAYFDVLAPGRREQRIRDDEAAREQFAPLARAARRHARCLNNEGRQHAC